METFAQWFAERALAAGYDVDSPRGGGRAELAEATGLSRGQISRTLSNDTTPDIRSMARLAKALRVPLRTMLIKAGYIDESDIPEPGAAAAPRDLEGVARDFGIPEDKRHLFFAAVESVAAAMTDDARAAAKRQGRKAAPKRTGG